MEQDETKELEIVDGKLEAAIAPLVNTYSEISITKELFKKYCVPGATEAEIFFCMGKTRALGLDPLMPGYVHYIKFPGKPYDLFVGYPEYLKQAYANGLEHLSYEFTKDEEGLLLSVITTLDIKGRDKPFVWETWYDEVVALTKEGVPNWRWQKAPRSQLRKCGGVDTIRYSGLLTMNLPYIPEEMSGEPVAEGYRSIPQALLDVHGVETLELAEATPGPVTATDHQIDLSPLHKIYRGKLAEREIFPDDTTRKMWQSEIIGKASTGDWDAADFNESTAEIESGRCEQWVRDNQPKPEPDPPAEAKTIEEQIAEKAERLEKEAAERMAEEKAMQKGGDATLDNMSDMPPKPTFLAEGEKRFADIEKLDAWCVKKISSIPWDEWTDANFETALPKLLALPLLAAQDAVGEQAQDNTTKEQEQPGAAPEWDVTSKTRRQIGELLAKLKIYDGPRSPKFKVRILKLLGRDLLRMQAMMESEGQEIIASLSEELELVGSQGLSEEEKKAFATGQTVTSETVGEEITMTPEDAKMEAFTQAKAAARREGERVAAGESRFQTTPEWAELNKLYNLRIYNHFKIGGQTVFVDPHAQIEWNETETGVARTTRWLPEHFAIANAGLDAMGIAEADAEIPEQSEPATAEEQDDGLCTDDEYRELGSLFQKLLPKKQQAMGSAEAHDLIRESGVIKFPEVFKRIKNLTTDQVSDLKHFLNDKISDMKANATERAKAKADAEHGM